MGLRAKHANCQIVTPANDFCGRFFWRGGFVKKAGASSARSMHFARTQTQGCIKLAVFSLSSIGWWRGLGRGGPFLLVAPLLSPLPTRASRGEEEELDAALPLTLAASSLLARNLGCFSEGVDLATRT